MFELVALGYTRVRDYVRYCEEYPGLTGVKGDLKDAQRPWVLEAVQEHLPAGDRVLDLGGARCELAGALDAAGYRATVVDPYEGNDGGPPSPDPYRARYPGVNIIQGLLGPDLLVDPQDAVVSTSVIEHIPPEAHAELVSSIASVLRPGGLSIHAVDLTCRGVNGFLESQIPLCQSFLAAHGVRENVGALAQRMLEDVETYWLPVTMYQQWRRGRPFGQYPWRLVGTMNVVCRRLG